MSPNASQLSALSRLFSPGLYREMSRRGESALFTRLLTQTGISWRVDHTVADVFDTAFEVLQKVGHRDEYVYRAALTKNVLLGTHSLNSASMLTEFRAGDCKADLAILNGTSTVYEIKSERDSLSRLGNQIENYQKVFAKVFVIASEFHASSILQNTKPEVGVLCLNRRGQISKLRDAVDRSAYVCPVKIFESMRSDEARSALSDLGITVPDVPNTMLRGTMCSYFSQLEPQVAHAAMVNTLKKTRSLAPLTSFVQKLPVSLRPIALSVQITKPTENLRFLNALSRPITQAMEWI